MELALGRDVFSRYGYSCIARFGVVRTARWSCHRLDSPAWAGGLGGTGRTLLGMNSCSSGIGTKSHSLDFRTPVLSHQLQVFGQEQTCGARHVSARASWLFLSCKASPVFFFSTDRAAKRWT